MSRQIVLDTETTGIRVEDGHRVIEIACVELIDRKLTGEYFHSYINPEREIESGALAVHGISQAFLQDKPLFSHIAQKLMDFVSSAELIIHNAPFDLSFLNYELNNVGKGWGKVTDYCRVIDTLPLARQLHVGQRNSLDALCKRYGIDHSKRDLHGALLDAQLLAQVYLAMTGGQSNFFDNFHENQAQTRQHSKSKALTRQHKQSLLLLQANEDELKEHENYLKNMQELGSCLWKDEPVSS